MAIPAVAAPAIVVLKRRRIGSMLVLGGVIAVAVGFFLLPLAGGAATAPPAPVTSGTATVRLPVKGADLALPVPPGSAFEIARHAFDHPPLQGGLGSTIVDMGTRAGVVVIAAGALLCLVFNVLPLMRGLVGVAAGLGLMGTAITLGVVLGERSRALAICAGSAGRDCHIDPQGGIWLIGAGFVIALVGGAIGALRPLAGLIGGLSFTIGGAVLGSGLAWLVTQQHALDVGGQALHALPH